MQSPTPSPYRVAPAAAEPPVFSFRVYPTPSAPIVLDAVTLVLVVAGAAIGAPAGVIAVVIAAVVAATRRFVVVDHQRRELRVMYGHSTFGWCAKRHPLDQALVEVRTREVRTVHKQNGRTVGSSTHDEHLVTINGDTVTRTRSSVHAEELAAQLCYAIAPSERPAPPARHATLQHAIARSALAALTLAALARTPVAAIAALRFSPFANLVMGPVGTATTFAAIALFAAALGARLARVLHDPCAPSAAKTARASVPAIAALAGLVAIGIFFATSATVERRRQEDIEERLAYHRRIYGEPSYNVAPTPSRPQLPETPPTVASPPTRCASITREVADQRLAAVGFEPRMVTLQEASPEQWAIDIRHPSFGVMLRWYNLDEPTVSGSMLDRRLVIVRGPVPRTRTRIVDAFNRNPSQSMDALMRSLRLEPMFTNSTSIRGRDRSGLYWLADVRPDPAAPWLHSEREALIVTGYGLGQTTRETANAWAAYAASVVCAP